MTISVKDLSFAYGAKSVLGGITCEMTPGITAVIGANAIGKSTLIRCLAGLLPCGNSVRIDGRPVMRRDLSGPIGYLPQSVSAANGLSVRESVLLGLYRKLGWRLDDSLLRQVDATLATVGIADLADRPANALSGGQLQLVRLARTLVREPSVLLLDEPTNGLDLARQFRLMTLLRRLTHERKLTTVVVLHDLTLAARFADRLALLDGGTLAAVGTPGDVLTPERLRNLYGLDMEILATSDGHPVFAATREREG